MQFKEEWLHYSVIRFFSILCLFAIVLVLGFTMSTMHDSTSEDKIESIPVEPIKDGVVEEDGDLKLYIDGNIQTNTWIEDDDGKIYYTGINGRISTGRVEIDSITYYFNEDGSLYTGWKLAANHWYYFTRNGAATGYQTIQDEYGNSYEYYFDDNGYLVTGIKTPDGRVADDDGYLVNSNEDINSAEGLDGFEYSVSDNIAPGQLSGISISGEPAEFYMLSIAGETSGGQIIMGDRGRAYGLCQFDYRYDLTDFIKWAYSTHPELWVGFESYLSYSSGSESLVGNQEIQNVFITARKINYEAAISDELLFMRQRYWDNFQTSMEQAGFNLSGRHIAVSAAMFSVNVNCGAQPDIFINNLSPDMTDVELICETYKIRNTLLANQAIGRNGIKGTTRRYLSSEPQMALDLYHGYTTIDTVKNYGNGVQWCKNIFSEAVTTVAIPGNSSEWDETISTEATVADETVSDVLSDLENDLQRSAVSDEDITIEADLSDASANVNDSESDTENVSTDVNNP